MFKLSIDKDYYKPILDKSGYNGNYVQYESKGDKTLTLKEYLDLTYKKKMKGSEFEFDGVNFLYYDFNKISINRGGSYIDSPKWLKDKKSTINPINNDYKCFQYAITLALNLDKIRKNPQRISKIKPFIDQYNWKDINFPATSKDWKKLE